jgi:hypothetical protein
VQCLTHAGSAQLWGVACAPAAGSQQWGHVAATMEAVAAAAETGLEVQMRMTKPAHGGSTGLGASVLAAVKMAHSSSEVEMYATQSMQRVRFSISKVQCISCTPPAANCSATVSIRMMCS